MGLSKEQILAADDLVIERVPTPEWGGDGFIFCRALSGDQRDRFDQLNAAKRWPDEDEKEADWTGIRALLISMAHCDEHGTLYSYTPLEIVALGKKNGKALDRVYRKIRDISGLNMGAVEEAEKNSPSVQSENSGSNSASDTESQ